MQLLQWGSFDTDLASLMKERIASRKVPAMGYRWSASAVLRVEETSERSVERVGCDRSELLDIRLCLGIVAWRIERQHHGPTL
jgi:hypothetical protein